MALIPSFSVSQTVGADSIVVLTDTSTGTDALVKSRVVYLQKTDGTFLVETGQPSSVVIVAEVKAICFIGGMTLRTTGDLITVAVADPVLGTIIIASLNQAVGDSTLTLLITHIINAINADTLGYGYTASNASATTLNIIAKTGVGATINGSAGTIAYPSGSTASTFSGGVTQQSLPIAGQVYNYWPYADSSVNLDVLDKDYALQITVHWLNATNGILYSATGLYGLTSYNEDFDYNLTTMLAANPLLINDNSFRISKTNLRLFIDSGDKAITRSSDIDAAQLCYDQATQLRVSSQYYFNESNSS